MLSNQAAFMYIIAIAAIWLVCKFCGNLALRVWLFIAIILGFVFVLGGGFSADGLLLLGMTLPAAILPVWAAVLAILRYGFKQSITR